MASETTPDHKAAFATEIRKCRLFVLGAGFSVAAGVPLTVPVLSEALQMFATECPGIYARGGICKGGYGCRERRT